MRKLWQRALCVILGHSRWGFHPYCIRCGANVRNPRMTRREMIAWLWTRVLMVCGLRSACCGARIVSPVGWAREYCADCGTRLS